MLKIEFQYNTSNIDIQAKIDEKMRQACSKFIQKTKIDINNVYFIYSGNIINLDLTLEQIINKVDKERSIMSIIVIDHSNESGNNNIVIPPYIICPICKEPARYEMKEYRIKIYNCRNGHTIDDILIKDFENTQILDQSLIKCDKCKIKNKSNSYNNEMYISNECNMNLCPLCTSNHDKNHIIINYEQKYYICNLHNKEYISYCETCHKDFCILCKKEHKEHKNISYDEIIPENLISKEYLKLYMNFFKMGFKAKINMIIDRFNNITKNIEIYIKLIERYFLNYNITNINYNILQNINYIYNNKNKEIKFVGIEEDLLSIGKDAAYKELIPKILNMYNKMNKNEIDLIYNIPNNEKEIKIFGSDFVKNNKEICKIIYNDKEYDLAEKFNCQDVKESILKIKLKGINNVNDLSCMFKECSQLSFLSNFSNWDTTYVYYMKNIFQNCKCLELPDISNWNTSNVIRMDSMFEGCSLLKKLPDLSNWNTCNVLNMRYLFKGCSSLNSMPDISKWDITVASKLKSEEGRIQGIEGMFDGCSDSLNIPEKFKI